MKGLVRVWRLMVAEWLMGKLVFCVFPEGQEKELFEKYLIAYARKILRRGLGGPASKELQEEMTEFLAEKSS